MSAFTISKAELKVTADEGALSTYEFGSGAAKHHFCNRCGIYPFHQSMRQIGYYRINLGCLEGIDPSVLPFEVFNGASI